MELIKYLNKIVHIDLKNSFYYIGEVIEADKDSITIIDKHKQRVSISKESIAMIKEFKGNN